VLSPDPSVQSPTYTQNYNRYSYCLNNPLRYTDPSGYFVHPTDWRDEPVILAPEFGDGGGGSAIGPGSGSHWSDAFREYGNYMIGSASSFNKMYGEGASDIVQFFISNPALQNSWRQGMISIEKIRANGGYWIQTAYTGKSPNSIVVDGIIYTMGNSGGGVFKKWVAVSSSSGQGRIDVDKTLSFIGTGATLLDGIKTEVDIARELGATSKVLPFISKALGPVGYVAIGVNTISDIRDYHNSELSGERFSWRTAGTVVGIGVTIYFGAMPGSVAGGLFYVGEKSYDAVNLFIDKVSEAAADIQSGRWIPGQ
jgi:hypothetical protein